MASIRDVAKLAGVSPATVSRVMNGTARVDQEKRDRVLWAIEQTGFVPNEIARSLFKKSARLIGLIVPSIRNPFFTELAAHMDEAASRSGYRLFLCDAGSGSLEKEKAALQMLTSMNADGIILASANPEIAHSVEQCRLPVVAVDSLFDTRQVNAYIYCDDYQGGRLAAEHLLDCGCKHIVCIHGPHGVFSAEARYRGYHDVCAERGLQEHTVSCDYDFQQGLAMAEELLRRYPQVDGIIACNDIVAISTYKILHKKQISVPQQVQLIGFDDIHMTTLMTPELTTIRQPIRQLAETAVSLLLQGSAEDKQGTRHVLPVTLVPRETTCLPK